MCAVSAHPVRLPATRGLRLAAVVLAGLLSAARAQGPSAAPAPVPLPGAAPAATNNANALDCMIQPHQVVQVGSPAPGIIEQILVERGDLVKPGQVLVQLQANVERAAVALARERADQVGDIRSAVGANELATRELQRANDLHAQKFVSATYIDKARAEAQVAAGRNDSARERRRQAERELELATAQLAQRTIKSPIGGVVVDRFLAPGEYVEQKPVLRIASIDPLRVDVLVPASAFGRVQVGAVAKVTPEMFGRGVTKATVKTVDRVIDAASNTFRVRLELPNPDASLPAGLRCKVDLGVPLPTTGAAPPMALGAVTPAARGVSSTALPTAAPPAPAVTAPPAKIAQAAPR